MSSSDLAANSAELVSLRNITKVHEFGSSRTKALADVSLDIGQGEYVVISGRSGSGKSSLLSLIGLLDQPTSGTYQFRGKAMQNAGAAAKASLRGKEFGFIFQAFNLIPDLTVEENVALPLIYRDFAHAERRARTRSILESVSLTHRRLHYPPQLSGGEQQRAAIARALVGNPSIVLADEPTGNLDTATGQQVMELISGAHNSGATVCLVTHDVRYATGATQHLLLSDGQISAVTPIRDQPPRLS